jgi:hypothetical protein
MTHVTPPHNAATHRAAIDALEAQRAAYRRYARTVEQQQGALNDGDADKLAAFADEATAGFEELERGARALHPLVERARAAAAPDEAHSLRRVLDELAQDARAAELAIHNLTLQLEAWRDAYGRQLSALGLPPGAARDGTHDPARHGPYVQPGFGRTPGAARPTLIDRKG